MKNIACKSYEKRVGVADMDIISRSFLGGVTSHWRHLSCLVATTLYTLFIIALTDDGSRLGVLIHCICDIKLVRSSSKYSRAHKAIHKT